MTEATTPESPSQQPLGIPYGKLPAMTAEAERLNTLELTLAEEPQAASEQAPPGNAPSVQVMDEDTPSEMSVGRDFQVRPSNSSDFNGDREKGQSFLNSCSLYFSIAGYAFRNEQARISWALTYFKTDQAAGFADRILRTQSCMGKPYFANWAAFELEFKKRFMPRNRQVTAITQFSWYQGPDSVDEYTD
ncbi:hypothetical protein M422DRAFT_256209 [Sphaerobolus stellatus SS14]|uniref:Retrotransposon gag domain-containing protein n=1 Tax=Sphaerobolus stellatus (strain SS14) TaxID=990650 RepID=A0A0C9V153_SPHS4|nr:hypothetical protein M422DRAFT_256209 [Sphaerobolus stellatus SS14]